MGNSIEALIIVDMLNDFMTEKGVLFCGKESLSIIPQIKKRLEDFRRDKKFVIFLKDSHSEDDEEFKRFPPHCIKGTKGSEIIDELSPVDGEIIIPKTRFSGFYNTDLDLVLKENRIEKVYLTGVCTSICVMDTASGLADRDYEIVVPENEVADFDMDMHRFSIKRMSNLYGAKII